MNSDVIPNKKTENTVLTLLTSYSVKGLQAVNMYLGYFMTSSYGIINFINLCYSVWAYPLGAWLAGPNPATVSSKSRTSSPTCNFISPDILS